MGIFFRVEWASFFASNTTGARSAGPLQKGSRGSSGHPQSSATRTSNQSSDFRLEACRLGNGSIAGACGMLGGGVKTRSLTDELCVSYAITLQGL